MAPPTMALGLMRNFLLIRCMHTAAAFSRFTLRANIRALQRMPPIASMATMPARVSYSPEVVEVDATQRHVLDSVNLSAPTLKVLQKKGFETLTAIQAAVFPCAREGNKFSVVLHLHPLMIICSCSRVYRTRCVGSIENRHWQDSRLCFAPS